MSKSVETATLLKVENSLTDARWVLPQATNDEIECLVRQYDVPEIIARLFLQRQISFDNVQGFLYPSLARDFPDPFLLKGMDALADDVAERIMHGETIGVFGDFDVDGATSTAILSRFLKHFGLNVPFHIPDRIQEGYGPNLPALEKLKDAGADFVFLCDCGITAFDVVSAAKSALSLPMAILDHHEAEDRLPPADHVVDPKRQDDTSNYDMLAACGVTFLACVAINAKLREKGHYNDTGVDEPPLKSWIDLVALGTVCDMVPLTGPNRLFVKKGFEMMQQTSNEGLAALIEVSKINGGVTPQHAGFALGPRINAGSRVHHPELGARLLMTDDEEEARNLAFELTDCNDKRKDIQQEMLTHALAIVEDQGLAQAPVIVVGHENWHPGLSGLVAGRLKERYNKPAICITYAKNEKHILEGRGSGRSIPGVNIGAAFIDARNEGIVCKGGGHAMAAGFTVQRDREEEFKRFLFNHIETQMAEGAPPFERRVDGVLSVRAIRPEFIKIIEHHFGPYGQGHDEPVFVLPNVNITMASLVGKDHVRCMVNDWEGGTRLKAIAFGSKGLPLGDTILQYAGKRPFHVAGTFNIDSWNGQERAQMIIQDAVLADQLDPAEDKSLDVMKDVVS